MELAVKKNIQNKGKFVKGAFDLNLDVDKLGKNEAKIKELSADKEEINLDIYFQLDDYIKAKKKNVSKATINVFNNIKAHLKAYEQFPGNLSPFDHLILIFMTAL